MDFLPIKETSGITLLSVDWSIINIERNPLFFFILKIKTRLGYSNEYIEVFQWNMIII